jgi:(2R)-ethylmalonyl-CoA mutase
MKVSALLLMNCFCRTGDDAHIIGLSILSGSHIPLMGDLMAKLRTAGLAHIPVVVGGIIPEDDADRFAHHGR